MRVDVAVIGAGIQGLSVALRLAQAGAKVAVLGVELYERSEALRGAHGSKTRRLTGPTGPLELMLPRARLFTQAARRSGPRSWAALPAARTRGCPSVASRHCAGRDGVSSIRHALGFGT